MILKHFDLIKTFTLREIKEKYLGTFLGVSWVILNPLLLVSVYGLVFTKIFSSEWEGQPGSYYYLLMIYSGIIIYNFYSEIIIRSADIISTNKNLITKIKFPTEILHINSVGVSLFGTLLNCLILIMLVSIYFGGINPSVIYLPLVLIPFGIFVLGVSYLFSIVGVYFKDFKNIITFLLTLQYFMSPIFYPMSRVPEQYKVYLEISPVTFTIEQVRKILIEGANPDFENLLLFLLFSVALVKLAIYIFRKFKDGLSDAL